LLILQGVNLKLIIRSLMRRQPGYSMVKVLPDLNPPKITDGHVVLSFRVLRMMRAVSSHTDDNRMTASAVAACMAPLLLRPLLAGDCGLEDETEVSPDNAAQLLAATAAANNAQSIVTTLLEEYDHIFEVS
jgi:hypothetical protein